MIYLTPLLTAALFRLRGMHHSWLGTQGARILFWAFPMALITTLLFNLGYVPFFVFFVSYFISLVICDWGEYFTVDTPYKLAEMSKEGFFITAIPGLYLTSFNAQAGLLLAFSGCLAGLAYKAGHYLPKWMGQTEWGELITGLVIGLFLIYGL